jgi:hypothetical protein
MQHAACGSGDTPCALVSVGDVSLDVDHSLASVLHRIVDVFQDKVTIRPGLIQLPREHPWKALQRSEGDIVAPFHQSTDARVGQCLIDQVRTNYLNKLSASVICSALKPFPAPACLSLGT